MSEQNGAAGVSLLVKALESVSAADLADLDRQIAEARAKVDGLLELRRLVNVRVNGRQKTGPRPKGEGKAARKEVTLADPEPTGGGSNQGLWRRKKLVSMLAARGGMTVKVLAAASGIPDHAVNTLTRDHPWFVRDGEMVRVSTEGRQRGLDE